MSFDEAEILRERANEFLITAEDLFNKGFFDLAAFSIEQYCQLIVKYKLLAKVGYYREVLTLLKWCASHPVSEVPASWSTLASVFAKVEGPTP